MTFTAPSTLLPILALAISSLAQAQTLKVGDPAPPLSVARWIKGTPVKDFKPGMVYVVEFWATWCGPCKTSIPHLTELAKKYSGKVTFAGISVLEKKADSKDTSYLKGVEAFVKGQGNKMVYSVGADGPEGSMEKAWLKPAGVAGIPTAMVISAQGKLLFVGHPTELEGVLDATLAGTFDASKASAKREADLEQRIATEKAMTPFFQAMKKDDYPEAARLGQDLFSRYKSVEMNFGYVYYIALSHVDQAKADAYGRSLAQGAYKNSLGGLTMLTAQMVGNAAQQADLPLLLANQLLALLKDGKNWSVLDVCAQAHAKAGQYQEAAALGAKALAQAEEDGKLPPKQLGEVKARLAGYQAKALAAKA